MYSCWWRMKEKLTAGPWSFSKITLWTHDVCESGPDQLQRAQLPVETYSLVRHCRFNLPLLLLCHLGIDPEQEATWILSVYHGSAHHQPIAAPALCVLWRCCAPTCLWDCVDFTVKHFHCLHLWLWSFEYTGDTVAGGHRAAIPKVQGTADPWQNRVRRGAPFSLYSQQYLMF